MVLLSLLLATEMSVFFNSSPELVNLRNQLSVIDSKNSHDGNGINTFCIGFVLLLNICVTISGILATFTTWNIVGSISNANAHCLLRSSLGQYVTTLSPRLVVCSLYLFLLWFLLFVVDLIFNGGSNTGTDDDIPIMTRDFLKKHFHLLILWTSFLFGVVTLFFCIVVPLSAFGRLVLHTGAMSERPVLSESLELDLLPRGLHAGLVNRAHHSQRRYGNTASGTRQYRNPPNNCDHHSNDDSRNVDNTHFVNLCSSQRRQQDYQSRRPENNIRNSSNTDCTATNNNNDYNHSADDKIINSENNDNDLKQISKTNDHKDGRGMNFSNNNDCESSSLVYTTSMNPAAALPSSGLSLSSTSSLVGEHHDGNYDDVNSSIVVKETQPLDSNRHRHRRRYYPRNRRYHRRIPTNETMKSLFLPPATILNLSMSANEFNDLIDNTIDTSSVVPGLTAASPQPVVPVGATRTDGKDDTNILHDETSGKYTTNGNIIDGGIYPGTNSRNNEVPPDVIANRNSHQRSATVTERTRTHHRRVSSSRFLLQELQQENNVRDMYGAAPLDLPQEIVWTDDDEEEDSDSLRNPSPLSSSRWLLSPLSSYANSYMKNNNRSNEANSDIVHQSSIRDHNNFCLRDTNNCHDNQNILRQPLLSRQHFIADCPQEGQGHQNYVINNDIGNNDEETGEDLPPPVPLERRETIVASNRKQCSTVTIKREIIEHR